ncbi:3-hydroxybutyryl-CoA dehydrogenase [Streptomyces sp. SAI-170]|uniref:3-hydroxyacyl-CoA dehydrogenase NAD-binding domain-containing protein n=1 Tax=Streptomyces sp. SAI-170 TaxID=3377729 RepID=UPI003C7E8EF2
MSRRPAVIGVYGLLGLGEALIEVLTGAGHEVLATDPDPEVVERLKERLDLRLTRGGDATKLTLTADTVPFDRADLVVEAVADTYQEKTAALRVLAEACAPQAVLCTTSQQCALPRLAASSGRPARTLGLRCATPLTHGTGLELVTLPAADEDAVSLARTWVTGLGGSDEAVPHRTVRAASALIADLTARAAGLEAEGYATADDIDTAMRLGCGLPIGVLALRNMKWPDTAVRRPRAAARFALPEPRRRIGKVGVVGSGTMARGIAEAVTLAGHPVVLVARAEDRAERAAEAVAVALTAGVRRGKVSPQERVDALGRLGTATRFDALADCDLVIEAVAEDQMLKLKVFAELDSVCRPDAVLATTTSSLSVTLCGELTRRPENVVGLHFFNPVRAMKLVEVVHTGSTSSDTLATVQGFCEGLGKTPLRCGDRPGFIVNHLLFPYLNAAVRLVESGEAEPRELDRAIVRGYGFPLGPLALLDVIGLDVALAIQQSLHEAHRRPHLLPAPLLRELAAAGRLGRKTGGGFYAY